jgi:integrase
VKVPKLCRHKAKQQGYATINGREVYFGAKGDWPRAGSKPPEATVKEYEKAVRELLSRGGVAVPKERVTVARWAVAFAAWSEINNDAREHAHFVRAMALLDPFAADLLGEFTPKRLRAIQAEIAATGVSRRYANRQVARIVRAVRWAVAEEMCSPDLLTALQAVEPIKAGRTAAKDLPPIEAVDDKTIDATLPHMAPIPADMIRFQRLTGARPKETRLLTWSEVDRSGDVWLYRPGSHKTAWRGRQLVVPIGPQAQKLLEKYLDRPADEAVFSPRESVRLMRERREAERVTQAGQGNVAGTNRKRAPKRQPGKFYGADSYARAVATGCRKGKIKPAWTPNQVRHTVATMVRQSHGLEAAQAVLGHSRADVTQIYAERDLGKAIQVARDFG